MLESEQILQEKYQLHQKLGRTAVGRQTLNPNFVSWIETLTEPAIEKRFVSARQALEALKSGQVFSQKIRSSAFRKIPQPSSDRFKLNKSAEQLEIQFYNYGKRIASIAVLSALLFMALPLLFIWMSQFLSIIFIIIIIFLATLIIIYCSIVIIGERMIIRFDRDTFQIKRQLFCFTYGLQKGSLADIVGIFLNQNGSAYQVIIRSETRSYKLAEELTELESVWLAQEIQDWLNS